MKSLVLLAAAASCLHPSSTSAFVLPTQTSSIAAITSSSSSSSSQPTISSSSSRSSSKLFMADETEIAKAPTLNGKVVLPIKAMAAGLKGHLVPAVYAILNSNYKRGSGEGWEHVQHVSITRDLANDISHFQSQKDASDAAHVRALSFSYPQKAVMEDFANGWKGKVAEATVGGAGVGDGWGKVPAAAEAVEAAAADSTTTAPTTTITTEGSSNIITVGDDYEFDDDDDDMDDDDLDDYLQMMAESRAAVSPPPPAPPPLFTDNTGLTGIVSLSGESNKPDDSASNPVLPVVSPFDAAAKAAAATVSAIQSDDGTPLELNAKNVDEVLDEVRPYLISDGGNVSVDSVDPETGDVYLLLEGACGSCASSTVTMQMGIERVLKEKFGAALGEVRQVEEADGDDDQGSGKPTELTVEAVQAEVDRMATAIVAMGGVVRVLSVDPIGEVVIDFRGPNRVKKGLELAILDVEFVKHVKFVSE